MGHRIKYAALFIVSILFLLFGVHILIAAYRLNDPFSFIMTFFASNFIILISGAGAAGFLIRLVKSNGNKESE
jgi:hypothetical protein